MFGYYHAYSGSCTLLRHPSGGSCAPGNAYIRVASQYDAGGGTETGIPLGMA